MRSAQRALYERLLDEKNERIALLVKEIDYLRLTRGQPSLPQILDAPHNGPTELADGEWVSEQEEAEKIVSGLGLSKVHLPEILEGLGIGISDLA